MVLCDIGNSTYHFKIKNKDFKIGVNKKLKHLPFIDDEIYFISVNDVASKRFLKKYPKAIDIQDIIAFDTPYLGMGIDRKVVCKNITNGIIVDSGSAITVDIMNKGAHLGGFILPGIGAYKSIYPEISKKLVFDFKNDINLDKIPLNTNDAINYAIINSIITPILQIYKKYKKTIYFTGEDSKLLLNHFKKVRYKYKESLIFNSMQDIIKKNKGK